MADLLSQPTATTLTDHFKQALNMTRTQLQNGPSPLSSASQMGITSDRLLPTNLYTSSPPYDSMFGAGNADLGQQQAGLHFGAGGGGVGMGGGGNVSGGVDAKPGFFSKYGTYIVIGFVLLAVGYALWTWWKKRQLAKQNQNQNQSQSTERFNNSSNYSHANRPLYASKLPTLHTPPKMLPTSSTSSPSLSPMGQIPSFMPPDSQTFQQEFTQSLPSNDSSFQPLTSFPPSRDIREREQGIGNRGAEYSNPNIVVSQMVPMSTRVSTSTDSRVNEIPPPATIQPQQQLPFQQQPQQLPTSQQQQQQQLPIHQQIPITQQQQLPIQQQPQQLPAPQQQQQQFIASNPPPIATSQSIQTPQPPSQPIQPPAPQQQIPIPVSQQPTASDPNFTPI